MTWDFSSFLFILHIIQIVTNSLYFTACEHASLQPIMKCSNLGTTKHFTQAAQSLKNNLTESHELKIFIKI